VAKLLSRNGVGVLASFISPYRAVRQKAREETTNFIEVFVEVPLEEAIKRDVKGMYLKALMVRSKFHGESLTRTKPLDPNPCTIHARPSRRRNASDLPRSTASCRWPSQPDEQTASEVGDFRVFLHLSAGACD
jgi:adenylylsulfate kinase-like enzyme